MRKCRALIFLFSMVAIVTIIGLFSAKRESLKPVGTATHSLRAGLKLEMIQRPVTTKDSLQGATIIERN